MSRADIDKVEAAIVNSPYLAIMLDRAAASGRLAGIGVSDKPNQAGSYDHRSRSILLSPSTLNDPAYTPLQQGDLLTATLGHESSHAIRSVVALQALDRFAQTVQLRLQESTGNESHIDLTSAAKEYLNEVRYNEALAEQTGLNALASRIRVENDLSFDPNEFAKRAVMVSSCATRETAERAVLASGIRLNAAGYQDAKDPTAVEAIARCYHDAADSLGRHGESGYRNYNGVDVIRVIAERWHAEDAYARANGKSAADVRLNMAELELDIGKIERNGLDLDGRSFGFTDTSHGRLQLATAHHTALGEGPDALRALAGEAEAKNAVLPAQRAFAAPEPPELGTIFSALRADGRWDETQSRNIAAALLVEHKADPLSQRLDRVTVGRPSAAGETYVFAEYLPHGDREPRFATRVEASQAAQVPAERSLAQVEQLGLQQAQQHERSQELDAPAQGVPRMSLQH
ncbi:hypothetical protein [Lysobacter firmicutimachus]|uniref:Uncharacterized protein n=1 Tax=Lysobacter firmicutimachus TaxID=1792846 RepID=A0ABU8D041_9GAMM